CACANVVPASVMSSKAIRFIFFSPLWKKILSLRVFPRELRRIALQPFLLALESRLPLPGALQLVLHADGEPPQPVDLELDAVAVLEGREPAVIGAGGEDVTRLQRMDRRDPLDAARDLVRHVVGVVVLAQHA